MAQIYGELVCFVRYVGICEIKIVNIEYVICVIKFIVVLPFFVMA
jgi:hypothetical protein